MTTEGKNMLKVAYNYLSNKTSDEKIIDSYNGKEVALAFKYIKDNPTKDEGYIFGITVGSTKNMSGFQNMPTNDNNFRCCFVCLRCHLQTVFGEEGGDAVLQAIIDFIIKSLT